MIHLEFAVPIQASRSLAWRMLSERVERPEKSAGQVMESEVIERGEGEVVRKLTLEDGSTVTERVQILPEEALVYHLLDHPKFEGSLSDLLFQVEGSLWLSTSFRGRTREGVELDLEDLTQLREGFARSVMVVAQQIEESERAALETT